MRTALRNKFMVKWDINIAKSRFKKTTLKLFVVAILFTLIVSQLFLFVSTHPRFEILGVEKLSENQYAVNYNISSGRYQTEVNLVYFPVKGDFNKDLDIIYILYDGGRDTYRIYHSWTPYEVIVSGLYNHLRIEARLRGLDDSNIKLVDSQELSKIFAEGRKGIVIIPTVVTYNIILNPPAIKQKIIDSWAKEGGIIIWLGPHPAKFYDFPFQPLRMITPLKGWDDLKNWWARDVDGKVPVLVKKDETARGSAIKIIPENVSLVERGFYGGFRLPDSLKLSSESFITFQMKIDGMENISLLYIELKDKENNVRAYHLSSNQVNNNKWITFSVYVNSPDRQSAKPLNLNNIDRIYFNASVKSNLSQNATTIIHIKDIKIEKKEVIIPYKLPLTEARTNSKISKALSLSYGYVNLGASIDKVLRLNGTVLGKIHTLSGEEKRTSIALIPYGKGRIVIFGYGIMPPYHQKFVAKDIMQIIYSGILHIDGPFEYKSYSFPPSFKMKDKILLDKRQGIKWCIFAFSKERYSGFPGSKEIIELADS